MNITCPACSAQYPIEAGLLEDDGKRLAAVFGEMDPALFRPTVSYLRLFKPAKTALRMTRAITVMQEFLALVRAGEVSRDERSGLYRPAPIAVWIAGIEQMLQRPEALRLPLSNHNYLRQVVWGIADQADAQAERQREKDLRNAPRGAKPAAVNPLQKMNEHIAWLQSQLKLGRMTQDDFDKQAAETRAKYSGDLNG